MKKVKVSKEVAKTFGYALDIHEKREKSIADFMYWIKECMNESECTVGEWLKQHNLTDDDLINAYKYGWEVEYEFQVGDIVKLKDRHIFYVGNVDNLEFYMRSAKTVNDNKDIYKLVCKAENREDLKQCKNS